MGGRGSTSGGREKGGKTNVTILSQKDLISARGTQQKEVDETLTVFRDVYDEYNSQTNEIQLVKIKENDVMAYYDRGGNIAVNEAYFGKNIDEAYADCVKSGWHPSNGNKTALQATVAHELGHQLTAEVARKMGKDPVYEFDSVATTICNQARKTTKDKGVVIMAKKISRYASVSNAEAIAEAYSDVYCNGKKAKKQSIAIMDVVNSYLK